MRLDRAHWRLVAALRREGSLTAAAEALGVTQSAASQRLREAERRLGAALVLRRGKRIALSAAGERVAEAGEALERTLTAAETDAIWVGRRARPRLRMALGRFDGAGMAGLFAEVADGLGADLEFLRVAGGDGAAPLRRGEIDLLVAPEGASDATRAAARPILEDRLVALAPAAAQFPGRDALGPEEFADAPFLTYGLSPVKGWEYDVFFDGGRLIPRDIAKIESVDLIAAFVASGRGLSILPRWPLAAAPPAGARIWELAGPAIRFRWLLRRRDAEEDAETSALLDGFEAELRSRLAEAGI